jgi:hypothetical protein
MHAPISSKRTVLAAITLVVASVLACRFGSSAKPSSPPPPPPTPTLSPVPVSQAAADRLEAKVRDQIINSDSSEFTVTITDEEATSWLALQGTSLPLTDPQIHFGQDKVFISGKAGLGLSARLDMVASVTLQNGQVVVKIEGASMGPLAVPPSLLKQVSTTINESIAEAADVVHVTSVQVSPGQITIKGTKGD